MRINTTGLPGNDLKAPGLKVKVTLENKDSTTEGKDPVTEKTAQESRLRDVAKTALQPRG
jgi:hypothetical protein